MEFERRVFRRKRRTKIESDSAYVHSLQFYSLPPSGDVSIKEFDEMAIERLKILRIIERWNLSGQIKSSEDWMGKIYDEFHKNKSFIVICEKNISDEEAVIAARRQDHISHFILRLAYCKTEELRRWFISHEVDLFKCRFMKATATGTDLTSFLEANKLHYKPITTEEMSSESQNLANGTYNVNGIDQLESRTFFKVPFFEALELIKNRKVFVKNGFAYIPSTDLVTLIAAVFRTHLSLALVKTCRALPQLDDDERIVAMLKDFDKRYTGSDYSKKKTDSAHRITPELISQIAVKSFPLCMRQMQDHLHSQHHLKHGGRMQYGLFLKAAGLNLEDALNYWRSHFTKNVDVDTFDKRYAYNIRHNYGKEGKRINYTPYSCMKIITGAVGPGDIHGCPFRHSDEGILKQRLIHYKIPQQVIAEIMDLVSKSHYQIACQRYWEATHNSTLESGINHPNQYFEESMTFIHGTAQPKKNIVQLKKQHSVLLSSNSLNESKDAIFEDDEEFENSLMEC